MLSEILSKETCAACRFCCVFSEEARWELPYSVELSENEKKSEAPCPHLDTEKGCTLGEDKPVECRMWPLRVMEYCGKRYITVSTRCCAYSEEFVAAAQRLLDSGLAAKIEDIAESHPEIVRDYHPSYRLLRRIGGEENIINPSSVLFFRKAEIGDCKRIETAVSAKENNICEYSGGMLIALSKKYGTQICFDSNTLYVYMPKRNTQTHCAYLMPIGNNADIERQLELLSAHSASLGRRPMIWGAVSDDVRKICESGYKYRLFDERDWWDYVYSVSDLAALPGKAFRKRRTALNKFKNDYDGLYEYIQIDDSNIELIRKYQRKWLNRRFENFGEDKGLLAEDRQISYILDNFSALGAKGGYVTIDKKVAGYTISLPLGSDSYDMTTLKTSRKYSNVTIFLINSFAASVCSDRKYINFEEDIGSEGLRKFKNDLNPAFMLKKSRVEFE